MLEIEDIPPVPDWVKQDAVHEALLAAGPDDYVLVKLVREGVFVVSRPMAEWPAPDEIHLEDGSPLPAPDRSGLGPRHRWLICADAVRGALQLFALDPTPGKSS
jgi:hypothetical protein